MLVIVVFAFIGALSSLQMIFAWLSKAAQKVRAMLVPEYDVVHENVQVVENEEPPAVGLSHGVIANNPANENDMSSDDDDYHGNFTSEEVIRWDTLYTETLEERGQRKWLEITKMLWTENFTASMRGHLIQHMQPKVRREAYLSLTLRKKTEEASNEEVKQWHRWLNSHFALIAEIHMDVRKKDDEIKNLTNQLLVHELASDPHRRQVERFRNNEIIEKMQQTALTYDHENDQMNRLEGRTHGAWMFVSTYESGLKK